ncbi:uncharacterized protein PAC_04346 [Phialocephala subalpina]|uniref:Uncharacterized protein n=1 Tax=Phialocephala subalpina TaxID=576137 RepID=A0A1L7WNW7_9HELO|nr:uncharacterized protein PAC_04346 [Phialocephala subalpina]
MSYHHAQLENAASKQSQPTTITSPVMTTKSLHGYLAASRWAPEVSPPTVASLLACQGGIASSRFAAEDAPVTDKKAATQPKSTKGKGKKRNAPKPTTPAPKLTPAPASNVKATKSAARKQKPAKAASAPKPAPSAATFDATLSLIADQIEVAKAAQPHTPMPPYSWPQEEEQVFSTTAEDINLFEADLNPEPPVYIPAAFTEQEFAIRVLLDDPNFNISDWIEDIEMPSLDPTAAEFEPVQTAPTPQMPSPSAAWSHNLMCDTADHLEANKGAELPIPSPAVAWA